MSKPPQINKLMHSKFCKRCLDGLPMDALEADAARVVVGFYCLGAMDILGRLSEDTKEKDREGWREWIWSRQVIPSYVIVLDGMYSLPSLTEIDVRNESEIGGFKPGTFMDVGGVEKESGISKELVNSPNLVMTYTALLSLAILRDDFSKLNRSGILRLIRASQLEDGSFTAVPGHGEADMRMVYTAFAISNMLDDWSGFDVAKAIEFIKRCMTYEGGFGTTPHNEAQGGPTYCALASLNLTPDDYRSIAQLDALQSRRVIRWLMHNQCKGGGFAGRTEKPADACYSFWCGASLHILGVSSLVNDASNASFLYDCQFKYGGLAKAPDERPDPYHTYLSLAALALYPPHTVPEGGAAQSPRNSQGLTMLDPLLNATHDTIRWIRDHIPASRHPAL